MSEASYGALVEGANPNREEGVVEARSVDAAIAALALGPDAPEDRNPEKCAPPCAPGALPAARRSLSLCGGPPPCLTAAQALMSFMHQSRHAVPAVPCTARADIGDHAVPTRRVKAAFATFSDSMLPELKLEKPGLKQSQYKEMVWKLWQKSPSNPLNRPPSAS